MEDNSLRVNYEQINKFIDTDIRLTMVLQSTNREERGDQRHRYQAASYDMYTPISIHRLKRLPQPASTRKTGMHKT